MIEPYPPRRITRGEIYWIEPEHLPVHDSETRHPYVIVQDDMFNQSRILTVVVCALTSNINRASYPGNVLLNVDEGNLHKASVVEVSKLSTVHKAHLGAYIGRLNAKRIAQILNGIRFQNQQR